MRIFFIGLQFLTRIRIVRQDNWSMEDFGRSVKYFPLIGAVLGSIYALVAYTLLDFLPQKGIFFPQHIGVVLFLVLPILLTGGLHCDGFMDTMDGVFSGRSRDRMLEIMKDSRVGATGVTSFVLLLFLQWALLLDMYPSDKLIKALFIMPIISRLMMAVSITCFPYARPEGMGKAFAKFAGKGSLALAGLFTLFCIVPFGYIGFLCLMAAIGFTFFFARYVTGLLGGLTGDVYGAVTALSESLVLFVYLLF
jgi:adenosylcobinamide-GDP ribazoletransferase